MTTMTMKLHSKSLNENPEVTDKTTQTHWLKKLGLASFWFFLLKGLLWLFGLILVLYFGVEF
ncbi:MAG: hypothetical protein OEZ58_03405 [Gammaproteobacteria bacterium]|nr:hypothetical protein [Gammaproteobacteria bacterium]MDH5728010.1 hypothetical protein [Gammaproteobacteria bacterium]